MIRILLSRCLGERRWTQAHLSRVTGIRPATIWELYNEYAERLSLDHLNRLCKALDCKAGDLIEYVPDEEGAPLDAADPDKTPDA